jgi:hypothetical protein
MFTIFFSGEKLAFIDSLPKGQNMDSYYFCNIVLEGIKADALAVTRKATLRDFHIHMDNCKIHNSKFEIDETKIGRDPAHSMGPSPGQSRPAVSEMREVRTEEDERGTGGTGALARAGEADASALRDRGCPRTRAITQ